MRYLFALLLAAVLIAAMFLVAAGVHARLGTPEAMESADSWSGGQLLLISLARTIDQFGWALAAVIVLLCLAAVAIGAPKVRRGTGRDNAGLSAARASQRKELQ